LDDGIARMGEVVFSSQSVPELRALGLGSCIGLCVVDPAIKLACIAHIMLPEARTADPLAAGKYADTAVPFVVREMTARGAVKSRLRSAIVGGAQLFNFDGANDRLDVGKRNVEAVKRMLAQANIKLVAEDTGGKSGRTVSLNAVTGEVVVKQAGVEERRLASLS
jgi:chemotaxis protein CheD